MPCCPDRPASPRDGAQDGERGSTLVEVLAAAGILSAVVLCLANLWPTFDRLSFDLLLRQKAVMVLNGETERLAALYATTALGAATGFAANTPTTSGYAVLPNFTGSGAREAYVANTSGLETTTATGTFLSAKSDATVLVTGSGTAMRNYVWLDRARGLAAQLSWVECGVSATLVTDCWNGTLGGKKKTPKSSDPYDCYAFNGTDSTDQCRLVVVVLDYPFKVSASGVPAAIGSRTLTLSTIVGRRL